MTNGILLIAFGYDYDRLAGYTAKATRRNTDLPIHVVTNLVEGDRDPVWNSIPGVTFTELQMSHAENRIIKTNMIDYSPFDRTLYIDCDAVVQHAQVDELFDLLDDADMALYPHRRWNGREPVHQLYLDAMVKLHTHFPLTVYHGACQIFAKTPAARRFFKRWHRYWRAMGCGREMHALTCAAQHARENGAEIAELPWYALAADYERSESYVQHDYGVSDKSSFRGKFGIPNWKAFCPYDFGKKGQWTKRMPPPELMRENAGGSLCIAAYSWGYYNEYIPLFVYFALGAYPNAHLKIYTPEAQFAPHILRAINLIRIMMGDQIEMISDYKICPHFDGRKHARWVMPEKEFEDFDYVYMGDVDMFIAAEMPDLVSFHLEHAERCNIPYSNLRRWSRPDKASGLHFMVRKTYYEAMTPIINHYIENEPSGRYMDGRTNEQFLCHMLTETFGPPPLLDARADFERQRPHHGFHMGLLRSKTPDNHYYTPYWKELAPAIKHLVGDQLFQTLVENIKHDYARSRVLIWVDWLRQQRVETPLPPQPAANAVIRKPAARPRRQSTIVSDTQPKQPASISRASRRAKKRRAHPNVPRKPALRNVRLASKRRKSTAPGPESHKRVLNSGAAARPPDNLRVIKPPAVEDPRDAKTGAAKRLGS